MKENIKKNLLFTILVFLSLTIHAQKYQGSIVDAESQQSLPFATIYVDADHKALANANGDFFHRNLIYWPCQDKLCGVSRSPYASCLSQFHHQT